LSPAAARGNPTLMRMLAERLAPAVVESAHAVGWSIASLEAQAFAYLAVRSLRGRRTPFRARPVRRVR